MGSKNRIAKTKCMVSELYFLFFFYLYGNFSVKKVEFLKKDLEKRLTLQCQKKFLCKSHVIQLVAETGKSFFAKVTLFDHSIMSQIFHIFKICIEGAATDRRSFARRKLCRSLVRKKIFLKQSSSQNTYLVKGGRIPLLSLCDFGKKTQATIILGNKA